MNSSKSSTSFSGEIKKKRIKRVKNLKSMGGWVVFGLTMGVVLVILLFTLWAVITISFGAISGISLKSPFCWILGILLSLALVYAGLTHKN